MKYPAMYMPMECLSVTQAEGVKVDGVAAGVYSHKGRYAIDLGGADAGRDWCKMPATGPALKVVRMWGGGNNCNGTWFQTTTPTILADGRIVDNACQMLLHCDTARKQQLGIALNKIFYPGSNFYSEGKEGATAYHLHMQVGLGSGIERRSDANGSWDFKNRLHPYRTLWLSYGSTVRSSVGSKYNFVYFPSTDPIGELVISSTYKRRSGAGTQFAQVCDRGGTPYTATAGKYAVWEVKDDCYLVRPSCKQSIGGMSKEEWICCGDEGKYTAWETESSSTETYQVKITADKLNVRTGPGTAYPIATVATKGQSYKVFEEKNNWGKIATGWISLQYAQKV